MTEAEKEIQEMYLKGVPVDEIATHMRVRGYKTLREKPYFPHNVAYVIKRLKISNRGIAHVNRGRRK